MQKTYVLDTNILLHNPQAPFSFEDNDVVIPLAVIEEIDRRPVQSAADAMKIAQSAPKDKSVLMRAWGEGQSRYFTLGGK